MTEHRDEAAFRAAVRRELAAGGIPGPTTLNRIMGWGGGNDLQRAWAVKIRTEMFEAAGLRKDENAGRWVRR